jgi:hypothetical protein
MDDGRCLFLESFHSQVNQAINSVTEEWNLTPS